MMVRYFLLFFLFGSSLAVGQRVTPPPPIKLSGMVMPGYFKFPIMPGQANSLSGGLGDLRANHFHAGLDIRTGGREGLPVHAAADGYISRIAVFTGGYGNVLFIKHPNGMTTVYGHLKVLNDTLAPYLRQQQYARQTFEIDLRPTPNQFPVHQGDVIALSGNTGGSGGPHLHFEVRDDRDNLINPQLFNFPELSDNVPPYFERIALKTMTPDSRINGEYQRITYTPTRRSDGTYGISQPISATGLIGLEFLAYDKTSGSPYRNGLSCLDIRLDDNEVFAYNMSSFPNEQTRYINVHMNYEAEQLTGQRYHRGYIADGNQLTLYHTNNYGGRLPLFDGKPHEVTVTLFDAYEHAAELHFTLLPTQPIPPMADSARTDSITSPALLPTFTGSPSASITNDNNLLKLTVRNLPNAPMAKLITGRKVSSQPVSYIRNGQAIYLIDLNKTLPDSIQIGSGIIRTNFRRRILPGQDETYEERNINLHFSPKTLFDTLYLAVRQQPGYVLELNQNTIPLNDYLDVRYTPPAPIPLDTLRTKAYLVSGSQEKFIGGNWRNGSIEFRTRELGRFQLLTDVLPPAIKIMSASGQGISARISDDLSGIASFRAFVNGEWLLMQYDYKRALIWSDKLNPDEPFAPDSEVKIEVRDRAGNIGIATTTIKALRARQVVAHKKAASSRHGKRRR